MIQQSALLLSMMFLANAPNSSWINPPPDLLYSAPSVSIINFHEVDEGNLGKAIPRLKQRAEIRLTEKEVASFISTSFQCHKSSKPFLVRAVFGYRSKNGFDVQKIGSSLLVRHSSLAHSTPQPANTALVVCIDTEPKNVYIVMSVAE